MQAGKLIVIAAPSGSGKTTIAKEVLKVYPALSFSVSATTRSRRAEEVDGKDYFFLGELEFKKRLSTGDFIEWEQLYGDYYGTLKSEVDRARNSSKNLLFDVDVKGGLSIKKVYPDALLIFIRPPGIEALRTRLLKRQTEDLATVQRRLERVPMELELGAQFDHEVVNDDLEKAIRAVQILIDQYLKK